MVMMPRGSYAVLLVIMLLFVCGMYALQTSTNDHDTRKDYAVVEYSFVGGSMQRRELRTKVKRPPAPKTNPPRHYKIPPPPTAIIPPPPPPPPCPQSRRYKSPTPPPPSLHRLRSPPLLGQQPPPPPPPYRL